MSLPVKKSLKILQGATNRYKFIWKTGDPALEVDLTGATAKCQFRETISSDLVLLEFTTENGGVVLGGTSGTVELVISSSSTEGCVWRSFIYDLEIIMSNGDVVRFLSGSGSLIPEVTRG